MRNNATPKLGRITLKQFRAYSAYIRMGTIKGAASELNISPPAVSQQLSLLEGNVGMPLTVKTSDGNQPSVFGKEILLASSRIENVLEMCQHSLEKLGDKTSGRVSLGIYNSANYFAPLLIAEFKKYHPHIDVRIRIGNRDSIFRAFKNYEFDFLVIGRPPKGVESNNESIKQAVMAGLGVALISAHTVAAELKDGRLKAFDIEGLPIIRKWLVVRHSNLQLAPAADALYNFFIDSGVKYFPEYSQT